MDTWTKARRDAAARRRRIIMNNDGDDVHDPAPGRRRAPGEPAPDSQEAFWARRFSGLEETQVDSVFYSTGSNFDQHNFDSAIAELPPPTLDPYPMRSYAAHYIEQGRDCLQLAIDFCRQHGKEVFWSLRMNDTHDNWYPRAYPCYKKQHPEQLLFQPHDIGAPPVGRMEPHMNATAVDYGCQPIRDHQLAIVDEVCGHYDIDGVELDFMRQPIFFRPTLEGRPVEPGHCGIMTDLMRRVRALTDAAGRARGRPILVACRVPNTVRCNRDIGLDVEAWLAADLVDLLIVSLEHDPFTGELAELTELGHRFGVPVYANVGETRDAHWTGISVMEGWAAAATRAWDAGVDGLYTFNRFDPHSEVFRVAGEAALLAGLDKVYAIDDVGARARTWLHVLPPENRLPLELEPGTRRTAILPVADDVAASAAAGTLADLHLRIYVERFTYTDEAEFRLNGRVLDTDVVVTADGVSPVACGLFMLKARLEPDSVLCGENVFEARLQSRCASAPGLPAVAAVQLVVRYRSVPA